MAISIPLTDVQKYASGLLWQRYRMETQIINTPHVFTSWSKFYKILNWEATCCLARQDSELLFMEIGKLIIIYKIACRFFLSCAKYILFLVVNCFLWPHLILSYPRLTGLPFTHFPLVFDLSPADSLQAWNVKNAIMQFIHYHHHLLLPPLPWCNSPTRVGQGCLISEVSRARARTHTHTHSR
jgi:hypothetical protein